jgi:hypothetical protein
MILIYFLKAIGTSGVDDVRDVLDYYNGENDPLEAYKLNYIKYKVYFESEDLQWS